MSSANVVRPHLTVDEIDAYWREALPESQRATIEQHYLDCRECRQRMELVELLVAGIKAGDAGEDRAKGGARLWPAAALIAATVVSAIWIWPRLPAVGSESTAPPPVTTRPPDVAQRVIALSPATRDATVATIADDPGAPIVIFELDVREAGVPGTRFDIALIGPAGSRLNLRDVASSSSGVVRVSVEASLLEPGRFSFQATGGEMTIALPFQVARPR